MSKKQKIFIASIAAAVVLIIAAILIAVSISGKKAEPTPAPTNGAPTETPVSTAEPTPTPVPEETVSATIAVGGDVVMHSGLNTEAQTESGFDYSPIFGTITDYIKNADYAVCSLVTTFSAAGEYTSYPLFKSPNALAASLASVGFDLVNTATSHAVDSYRDGINYTLDVLDEAELSHVGTYRTEEERAAGGATVVDINGIQVAFMAYTCDTNQIPVSGFDFAVNVCTTDYLSGGVDVDYDRIAADMAAVKQQGADVILVFMSWGREFDTEPSVLQEKTADFLITQGADVIVGGHTRVPQPMEIREAEDAEGNKRTGYVFYSLGNLISCQNDAYTDISAILNITVEKGVESGDVKITNVCYEPIYMVDLYDYGINDYGWHYRLANLHAAIDSYESGEPWAFMTEDIYNNMVSALDDLQRFFGEEIEDHILIKEG